jgi:hypothetical protein
MAKYDVLAATSVIRVLWCGARRWRRYTAISALTRCAVPGANAELRRDFVTGVRCSDAIGLTR